MVARAPGSAAIAPAERPLAIERLVAAPRDRVFAAWTRPEILARWWAPKGCATPFCRTDPRPGGVFHYGIHTPEGRVCWGKGVYLEIVENERIVYADYFSDEAGNVVEPVDIGVDADWPTETIVAVTFADRDGATAVTVHQTLCESVARRSGALATWTEMLDRLAAEAPRA